ncbi:hypothetical protein MSAN_00653800 [Mycena sanguinolenta]|uniref:Uncharacterized protein n=1 Tax=Mycena sanguinolenta TaxID=230812 RepID=A0A8H6Z058_9AGAR|nr:hypothetical protein MSAN_00653800 [Mycena sanguinolenta]
MRVPQELVYLIIDNLRDDILSLKLCSLTARAFVGSAQSSAQTWIFNKVEILPPKSRDDHVGDFTSFSRGPETSFDPDEDDPEYLAEHHVLWVMSGRTLPLVLAFLDLKRISLVQNSPSEWNEYGELSMDWNRLGRSLKSALATVFSSPKLELRGNFSLKEMSISRVRFTQELNPTPWPESQPWHPQLQSLFICEFGCDDLCRYLLHPRIDLTRITSLTLAVRTEWVERMTRAAISGATQHLSLYEPHRPGIALKSILTPTLRSIHFFSKHLSALLSATFEAYPHNSRLERIVFEAPIQKYRTPRQPFSIDAKIQAAMEHLGALKSVEIRANSEADSPRSFHEWAEEIRAMVPSLVRRGLLTLTEITRAYEDPHYGWE